MAERLQKVLARAGYGSRREIEQWIRDGRITVNKQTAGLGTSVSALDSIAIDGKTIPLSRRTGIERRVIVYHKPVGEVCTRSDPEGRPTIFAKFPALAKGRWITVGRLDINTSGLLLLTTDGELAYRLMHPSHELEREYAVRILGVVDEAMLARLQQGVMLEDGIAAFDTLVEAGGSGANRWFHVTLKEGRKREVRRLWESQGVTVSRLMRVRYGPVTMPKGLRTGQWRDLEAHDLSQLLRAVGLETTEPAKSGKPVKKAPRSAQRPASRRPQGPRRRT